MSKQESWRAPRDELDLPRRFLDMDSQHQSHTIKADEKREDEYFTHLQFSDLRTWIYDDELAYKASDAFSVWRLGKIKQLSFLAYIGPTPETQYLIGFTHTRLEHTDQVVKIGQAILKRNNASEKDITLSTVSSVLHDKETPALGDAIKKIDQANLNEEDFWSENLGEKEEDFIKSQGLTMEQIDDVIHNRGIIGQVLDVSDRISYVMLDLSQLMSADHLDTTIATAGELGYREEIAQVLRQDTNVGSIYRDVVIDWENNDFYFRNPERLSRFLEIRALLNKYLYLHPISQARDMLVVQFVKPYYSTDESDDTKLTPKRLRKMTDEQAVDFLAENHPELEESVYKSLGRRISMDLTFEHWYPEHWEMFKSAKELEAKKNQVLEDGFFVRGSVESKGFNPLIHYKVLTDDGQVVTFKEYDPNCAARIERIADDSRGHILFWEQKGRDINAQTHAELNLD
ncbi:MAG TPA: hypothetical protein VES68_03180 [Candidatus Sulfotelmatobacter sp.]|nr:hypothetical protein [Candidatus Sulfotelmatobacter sp.]